MGVYESWKELTPGEKAIIASLAATSPHKVLLIKQSKDTAYNETQRVFGRNGLNDESDAFRHCFWSAILARGIGYFWAKGFTDAHESKPGNDPAQKAMDLHNNSVGLKIGFYYFLPESNKALSKQCYDALKAGKLKVISP